MEEQDGFGRGTPLQKSQIPRTSVKASGPGRAYPITTLEDLEDLEQEPGPTLAKRKKIRFMGALLPFNPRR